MSVIESLLANRGKLVKHLPTASPRPHHHYRSDNSLGPANGTAIAELLASTTALTSLNIECVPPPACLALAPARTLPGTIART